MRFAPRPCALWRRLESLSGERNPTVRALEFLYQTVRALEFLAGKRNQTVRALECLAGKRNQTVRALEFLAGKRN